jgi:hypothetical protein
VPGHLTSAGGRRQPIGASGRPNGWSTGRSRRPGTANLHLIVNQQTAMETGPVSKAWLTESFRGRAATASG